MWQFPLCLTLGKSGIRLGVSRETQWQITPVTFPVTQIHTRWQTPQMKPFLLSTQPYNRRLGGGLSQWKSASVYMCVLMSTDSLVWWKMLTFNVLFFPLFIKHKATDLTGPLHLTPPPLSLSHSLFLSTYLSLCVFGRGKLDWGKKRREKG